MENLRELKQITSKISVLYVEDNQELREVFVEYLKKLFYKVTSCIDGFEGLEAYKKEHYDIVISDINMPRIDGLSMAAKIKELHPYQHIIIVSAYKDIQNYIEAIKIGIDGYILKPIAYDQINAVLFKTIRQINFARENEAYKNHLEELVEEKRQQIRQHYITDRLTSLYNRTYFDELQQQEGMKTLLLLNVDNFSIINYNYGFSMGDKTLIKVVELLRTFAFGSFTLFRIEGDEFAFFSNSKALEEAELIAYKIKEYFSKNTIIVDEVELNISFTFGIDVGADTDLLRTTSLTVQHLRESGKNLIGIYKEHSLFEEKQKNNLFWIHNIKKMLQEKRVRMSFQPMKDLHTNEVVKYEALARILSVEGELIFPDQFLKALTLSGMTVEFTKSVIEQSFAMLQGKKNCKISINITEQDLKEGYLAEYLNQKSKEYGIEAQQVILEILESISTTGAEEMFEQIQELKRYGYRIAIDDFGTENSNFSRLLQLNVDFIKIDGSFIREVDSKKSLQEIVKSIVSFAHAMNIKVIAEFVHNQSVYEKVAELGIDYAQGYFIAKPSEKLEYIQEN